MLTPQEYAIYLFNDQNHDYFFRNKTERKLRKARRDRAK